jgi:hypothetical protein
MYAVEAVAPASGMAGAVAIAIKAPAGTSVERAAPIRLQVLQPGGAMFESNVVTVAV